MSSEIIVFNNSDGVLSIVTPGIHGTKVSVYLLPKRVTSDGNLVKSVKKPRKVHIGDHVDPRDAEVDGISVETIDFTITDSSARPEDDTLRSAWRYSPELVFGCDLSVACEIALGAMRNKRDLKLLSLDTEYSILDKDLPDDYEAKKSSLDQRRKALLECTDPLKVYAESNSGIVPVEQANMEIKNLMNVPE